MRSIELKSTIVHLRADGIMHLRLKAKTEITIQDARQTLQAMRTLGGGKKYPVLIDAGEMVMIHPEVREFSASEEGNIYTIADAIAYNSLAQKLIANFYIVHNKPVVPTQAFPDNDSAVKWLKTFITAPNITKPQI